MVMLDHFTQPEPIKKVEDFEPGEFYHAPNGNFRAHCIRVNDKGALFARVEPNMRSFSHYQLVKEESDILNGFEGMVKVWYKHPHMYPMGAKLVDYREDHELARGQSPNIPLRRKEWIINHTPQYNARSPEGARLYGMACQAIGTETTYWLPQEVVEDWDNFRPGFLKIVTYVPIV